MNRGVLRQDFDEAASLYGLIKSTGARRCIEIGRYAGGSTVMIASALAHNDGKLTSIDIAPRDDRRLRATLEKLDLSQYIELIEADANTLTMDEPLDLAFFTAIIPTRVLVSITSNGDNWFVLAAISCIMTWDSGAIMQPASQNWTR
jgi:cephalosporin hydroxylase